MNAKSPAAAAPSQYPFAYVTSDSTGWSDASAWVEAPPSAIQWWDTSKPQKWTRFEVRVQPRAAR